MKNIILRAAETISRSLNRTLQIPELTVRLIGTQEPIVSRFALVLFVTLLFTVPGIPAMAEVPAQPAISSPSRTQMLDQPINIPQPAARPSEAMQRLYQSIHIPQRMQLGLAVAIAIDPVHTRLIAAEDQGRISIYDLRTITRVASVEHRFRTPGWFGHAGGIVYDARRNLIFIGIFGAYKNAPDSIGVYDGYTLAYITTFRKSGTDPLDNPNRLALDSKNDRLIAGDGRGGVEFFDAGTLKYLSSLDLQSRTNPDAPTGFLGFDPIHRYLLKAGQDPKRNVIPPHDCIDVFNADTGGHIRTSGSCDPENPSSQFAFSYAVYLAVDTRTGLLVSVENDLDFDGVPIVRLHIVDSATLAEVASVDSSVDRNMFMPGYLTVNDGIAYVLFEDVGTSGKTYLERYDLTQLTNGKQHERE